MAEIRASSLFNDLIVAVREYIPPNKIRSCLSHHTTASCRKEGAPLSFKGLKGLGLNDPVTYQGSGQSFVRQIRLAFQHTFYADDLRPLAYCSREYDAHGFKKEDAIRDACYEVFAILLCLQPEILRMPLACLNRSQEGVDHLRLLGRGVRAERLRLEDDDPFFEAFGSVHEIVEDPLIHAGPSISRNDRRAETTYVPGTTDNEILENIQTWYNSHTELRASRLPRHAYTYFARVLPKFGLEAFFERNREHIEYWRDGSTKRLAFRLRPLVAPGAGATTQPPPPPLPPAAEGPPPPPPPAATTR